MMLSKFRALPPKWAIDERVRLQKAKESQNRRIDMLLEAGYPETAYRFALALLDIEYEKAKLEKRIREILIHGNINQRKRILEQGY